MANQEIHFAIAITRTCGSGGGSYIGKKLAQDYGIDVYDRRLLRLASEDSGINESVFAGADETTKKTLLYRVSQHIYNGEVIPPESGNFVSDQNLFNYQAKVLRELLDRESYVCIGRAAAVRYINHLDKYRNAYYVYHTGRQWKNPANYDLCLDTSALGLDNCVELIKEYIRLKFGAEVRS